MFNSGIDSIIKSLNVLIPILLIIMAITFFTGHFQYSYKIFIVYIVAYLSKDFACGFSKECNKKNKILVNEIIVKPN